MSVIHGNPGLRDTPAAMQRHIQKRTVIYLSQGMKQRSVLPELLGNADKVILVHPKRNRLHFCIVFVAEQIPGRCFPARKQRYNAVSSERKILIRFVGGLFPIIDFFCKQGFFSRHTGVGLHDVLDYRRINAFAPWQPAAAILCQVFGKRSVRKLKIPDLVRRYIQ